MHKWPISTCKDVQHYWSLGKDKEKNTMRYHFALSRMAINFLKRKKKNKQWRYWNAQTLPVGCKMGQQLWKLFWWVVPQKVKHRVTI